MAYINMDDKQRIFIGIPIGEPTQRAIDRLLESMNVDDRNLRWVSAKNRHLTLAFLGDTPKNDVETVLGKFARTYKPCGPFAYHFSALERFPGASGRIIALTGEASDPVHDLAMSTRDMLRKCGLGHERKEFRPHVTLARVRNPKHPLTGVNRQVRLEMDVTRVVLYRSTLTRTGSIYTELDVAELR